ncbi:MAG: serine hydrolase, partial [Planctomycetota bacterium]
MLVSLGARAQGVPDAAASDPEAIGWMTGFPPPEGLRIGQPSSDFFSFPKMRWSVCHIRELLPTKRVSRGLGGPRALEYWLDSGIDGLTFAPLSGGTLMTWEQSLSANYTDGMLILHEGRVVYERYFGALEEDGVHAAMSVTKSMSGLLAEMLIAEGVLDDSAVIGELIPELAQSGFGDATVRQVMDMTTGLRFSEDYSDPDAEIWTYNAAASPLPMPEGYDGPRGYFEYLAQVEGEGEHGERFGYRTVNTDVLAWVLVRATGRSLTDLLSERIWRRIGVEQDAYFTVDGIGTPFAGGGMSAGLRDTGRLGQLILDGGAIDGQQIIPAEAIERLREGGDREAFAKAGYPWLDGGSYRSMWWFFHDDHQAFAARGVHGQTIYIDPTAKMVIVRFASHPSAKNSAIDSTSLPAYRAVARYL